MRLSHQTAASLSFVSPDRVSIRSLASARSRQFIDPARTARTIESHVAWGAPYRKHMASEQRSTGEAGGWSLNRNPIAPVAGSTIWQLRRSWNQRSVAAVCVEVGARSTSQCPKMSMAQSRASSPRTRERQDWLNAHFGRQGAACNHVRPSTIAMCSAALEAHEWCWPFPPPRA